MTQLNATRALCVAEMASAVLLMAAGRLQGLPSWLRVACSLIAVFGGVMSVLTALSLRKFRRAPNEPTAKEWRKAFDEEDRKS